MTASLDTGPPYVSRRRRAGGAADGRERPAGAGALVALACRACGSENVPLTRRPVATGLGSATLSVASPAVEITFAVVDAVYVLRDARGERPERRRRTQRQRQRGRHRAAARPGALSVWTVTPLPPNSAQFRLNRLPPSARP